MEVEVKVFGIDMDLHFCGYVCLDGNGGRRRCPRTSGILRFTPAALLKSKATPPQRRHRPCHWTAAALGVLASRALPSAAAIPEYLQRLSIARGKFSTFFMLLAQSEKCRGLGGRAPKINGGPIWRMK